MKKIYIIFISFIILLNGCYTDTIESFSKFNFQLAIEFNANYKDRVVPRQQVDFSNLYEYKEYNDNKDKISKAEIYQINYWIDSLLLEDGTPFNPKKDTIIFDYIKYKLQFAKPKPGVDPTVITDSLAFEADPNYPAYLLGEFFNVSIDDFWRMPNHILQVPDSVATIISNTLKERPYYYMITEYSGVKGRTGDVRYKLIKSRFDVIIRFEVKL